MATWKPVSRKDHFTSHWKARNGFQFFVGQHVVPVMLAELAKLLPHYVIGFVKNDSDVYETVALVGLGGERNVYTNQDSKWLCGYVPAHLRGYPFSLLNDAGGNKILCIEESFLSDDEALPRLFREDGELDSRVSEIVDFLKHCALNREQTGTAVAALAAAGVIEPWPVSIHRDGNREPLTINGLHRIDEEKLNSLDADILADLREIGALALAYAQLFSIAQIDQLTLRAEHLGKAHKTASSSKGLDNLFSNEDYGSLNFDAFDLHNADAENK